MSSASPILSRAAAHAAHRARCVALLLTALCAASGASAQRGVPRTNVASPDADVYLVPLAVRADSSAGRPAGAQRVRAGAPSNLTRRAGYDNQPMFAPNGRALYYTANRGDGQSDIWRFDLSTGLTAPVRRTTPESEYSAAPILGDSAALAVIRVEADSTQRLWRLPLGSEAPTVILPELKPVGYFAQPNDSTWVTFVLGTPATLQVTIAGRTASTTLARDIGRSLHRIPGTALVSFVQKGTQPWHVMQLDVRTNRLDTLVALPAGTEDVTWVDSTTLLTGNATKLLQWSRGDGRVRTAWREVADFGFAHLARISRLAVSANRQWLAFVAEAQPRAAGAASRSAAARWVDRIDTARVRHAIGVLAADSMEGRLTGSPGMERAARWLERQYRAVGLMPAGDSGTYRQHIPLRRAQGPDAAGRVRPAPLESWDAWRALPAEQQLRTQNIAGVLRGSDPVLRDEVVLVTAHYDHIGVGRAVDGDSIYNGADDDASGNVALLEIARALRQGPRPKRTILFMSITGEEMGGIGTRWYLRHPLLPLEKTVVDLNIEMIAHPDSIAGGFGRAWLTGYERSTLGDLLADNGIPLVPDPRPGQSFFTRSDNAAFARIGIPAHSLSSFNLATPYHHPKDEAGTVNVAHMARVIGATARAVRLLADGEKPVWHPGGPPDGFASSPSPLTLRAVHAEQFAAPNSLVNAAADVDNDGDLDLFVGFNGTANRLYRNDGDHFTDIAVAAGVADARATRAAAFGDWDGDGDADLLVGFAPGGGSVLRLYRNDATRFVDVTAQAGLVTDSGAVRQPVWVDVDGDGDLDLFVAFRDRPNALYRNERGHLTDIAPQVGLADARRSVGAVWADLDADGDLDVIVGNMDGDANGVFRNEGGRFVDVAESWGLAWGGRTPRGASNGTVRPCVADVNGDGRLDVITANYGLPGLFLAGDTGWRDAGAAWGMAVDGRYDSCALADVDHDGRLDLYLNGTVTQGRNWPDYLYRQRDGRFELAMPAEVAAVPADHGVQWHDFDGNGTADLALTGQGPHAMFANRLPATIASRSLRVRVLDGQGRATRAGAEVRVYAAGTRDLLATALVDAGSGYDAQSDAPVHLGLARGGRVDVEVIWPAQGTRRVVRVRGVRVDGRTLVSVRVP